MFGRSLVSTLAMSWWWVAAASAAPVQALDRPVFTATPAELLALGKSAPSGDWPVVILREQIDISYDDAGRATRHWRLVFVVRTQAGVDDWGTLRSEWLPFHQDKPVLRARVVDPAGSVTELDPALITDAAAENDASNVLSDRRELDAPLPRLKIGAVVEEEVVTTDREPLLAVGGVSTDTFGNTVPTSSTVVSYTAPAARKAHHVERKLPAGVRVRHQITGGRETWIHEVAALPPNPSSETGVPGEVVLTGYVGIATAPSWAAVARAYRAVIDQRIAAGPVDLPAELPRTASLDTVTAIAGWLHHQVRYTGIELGAASLIPWAPAEVIKRGFGDCKDQATLLIALLRQAGIRADVVLLQTGPGRDIDPELPAVGVFDHAIVRARLDGRDLWIDMTDELSRPGQLPAADQGRRALVIADDTTGLSATPAARSADNTIHEVRAFAVAEHGTSQVTEVSRSTGVFESQRRGDFRSIRSDELAKAYSDYVDSRYAGKVDRVTASDPSDLAQPFELTVTASKAHRAYTERESIEIDLLPRSSFHELPSLVTSDVDKAASPRTQDYAWFVPHIYEVENRITVPSGYTMPDLPPDRTRSLGSATFTERRRIDGQTLIVTFRIDTGKPRVTPAELAVLRTGIAELRKEEIHISIPHTGLALGHAGKPREAIAECRRLIALHPKEAVHHSQLATVLLRAGAGEAARREARAAVALDPSAADAQAVLGWVLRFDTLGREFAYDWDRAGSIAALRKARALNPDHLGAAITLAEVLQRDPLGRLFEAGADLPGAAEAWRAAIAGGVIDRRLALAQTLLWSGRFADAEAAARDAEPGDARDGVIVIAVAATRGARQAIQTAGELRKGAARAPLIYAAASGLLLVQRYDLARELFAETSAVTRQPADQAALIARVALHPPIKQGTADPLTAARDVMLASVDRARETPAFWDASLERSFRDATARVLPPLVRNSGATRMLGDAAVSETIAITGDGGAWRATVGGDPRRAMYFVLDGGMAKVVGTVDLTTAIGRYALAAGDAPRLERARKLLDLLRADVERLNVAGAATFRAVWGSGVPSSADAIHLAGAVLARNSDPDRVIATVARCPTTATDGEVACHESLAAAYAVRGRWADAVVEIEKLETLRPAHTAELLALHANALARGGRCDDAGKLVDDDLAKHPDDRSALAARLRVSIVCRSTDEALQHAEALLRLPDPRAGDLNNVAWFRLVVGSDLPVALDLARRAVAQDKNAADVINTLAAIEVESDDLGHAIEDTWKSIALQHAIEPSPADWYVLGRLYDRLGLADDARAAYKRVPPEQGDALSSYALAQKQLAAMARH